MATQFESLEDSVDNLPPWRRSAPFILAVLLALAFGLILYFADRVAEQRDRVLSLQRHSFAVITLTNELDASIANSEALLARYVVSLDPNVGRQFQAEWRTARAQVAALARATHGSAEQQVNVAQIAALFDKRGKTLSDIALRVTYKQKLAAIGRFYAAGKSPDIANLHKALDRTIDHEKAELAAVNILIDRSEVSADRVNDSYALLGLGLLAAALLALWFAYVAMRERRFARHLAAAETARVDKLEIAVRERTEALQSANVRLRQEMDERIEAEQSLRQLQKMEAIGQLTGGIAHDFNNMLAVVVSGIELGRRALPGDPAAAQHHLDNAIESAHRAATLTARLLAYARAEPLQATKLDADALVLGMRELIDGAMETGITVILDLGGGGWCIRVEQSQFESALLNLAVNARDAMNGRGTFSIVTRRETLAEGEVGQCRAGDYVRLCATDTGQGMSQHVVERAFEPFFTTKPVGQGTGLGLSQIFSFVRQSGGEISIQSAPGQGTEICIHLPREHGSVPGPGPSVTAQSTLPPGLATPVGTSVEPHALPDRAGATGLSILVVEDDPRVLRSTLAALKALGHQGIACDHPRKAAELLALHPDIALILSDVQMPDMTGPEMIAALSIKAASTPVLFVTGFAGENERAAQLADMPMLRKPFTLMQLGRAIDQTLHGHRPDHPAGTTK